MGLYRGLSRAPSIGLIEGDTVSLDYRGCLSQPCLEVFSKATSLS